MIRCTAFKPFAAVTLAIYLAAVGGSVLGDDSPPARREPWTTSRVHGSPEPPRPYTTERAFPQLDFQEPVELVRVPGEDRFFLAELRGRIWTFPATGEPAEARLVWDGRKDIPGLDSIYGLTFDPDFATNRLCYVCYVMPTGLPDGSKVSRFQVTDEETPRIRSETEEVLITWYSGGHNGGCLQFGPDGYLYVSTGDGTNAFPPDEFATGQDLDDLLSCILRIDLSKPSEGRRYSIPVDNPFVGIDGARPEIWCYGLRNPWKMSFDPGDGTLWVGDVGWELWELVYRVQRGGNYGWSVTEGRQPVHPEYPKGPTPILPPTVDHPHTEAKSITGGYVYTGSRFPDLKGAYIYGDWSSGKIWGLRHDGRAVTWHEELADTAHEVICFGVDAAGELYIVDYKGTIHRLIPNDEAAANTEFPQTLSTTGLFEDVSRQIPATGVLPYYIAAEPWMNGLIAERIVGVPGDATMRLDGSDFDIPTDTVFVKTLSTVDENDRPRRLETQLLHFDGRRWNGYSYLWNDEQTDAVLVGADGGHVDYREVYADGRKIERRHRVGSRTECAVCHNAAAGFVLGFTSEQLGGKRALDDSGDSELERLSSAGMFTRRVDRPRRTLAAVRDDSADLDTRARSYLHVNCAHCHRRDAGGAAVIEFPFTHELDQLRAINTRPSQGTFELDDAKLIAPGEPFHSVLLYRLCKSGRGHMPQIGGEVLDSAGITLIADWIRSLDGEHTTTTESAVADGPFADRLRTTSGALEVAVALHRDVVPVESRQLVTQSAESLTDPLVYGLLEHFVEPGKRAARLGDDIDLDALAHVAGSAARGRELFWKDSGLTCKSCHRVAEQGGDVGPPLDDLGKRLSRRQVLESIATPSKTIDPKFATFALETIDGRVILGLLLERSDRSVSLRTAQGETIVVPAADVHTLNQQPTSLMPESLLRDLTQQEAADLVEYLLNPAGH